MRQEYKRVDEKELPLMVVFTDYTLETKKTESTSVGSVKAVRIEELGNLRRESVSEVNS